MTAKRLFALASLAVLCGSSALAQQMTQPAPAAPSTNIRTQKFVRGGTQLRGGPGEPGPRPDFPMGPPGLWWKNPDIVQKLTLTADQQKRMDDIFQQSRLQLIDLKANVEKQEVTLEPMLSANPPDTNKVLAQIDRVASARAELEKANARMLLGIRGVLSADQWTKLQAEQRGNMMFHFKGGPRGPGGPGGPDGPDSMRIPGGGGEGFKPHGPEDPISQANPHTLFVPDTAYHLQLFTSLPEDVDFDL
jgi:Spy/CpxP family protein refolding chaperone